MRYAPGSHSLPPVQRALALAPRSRSAILLAAVAAALACCAALLIYGSGRGLDLTDEIFYLVWTRDPRAYALTYQPFGFLLHPLFALVGARLQAYRLVGFAIAALSGALLGASLAPLARRTLFAMQGALAALTIFFPWIITPSYNSAANVGALLLVAGLVNALKPSQPAAIISAATTASGLCLAAFSKPPLFALTLVAIVLTLILSRNTRVLVALGTGVLFGAVLIFLLLPPAELVDLVRRILVSQHVMALPNSPGALPGKLAREWRTVPLSLSAAAIVAIVSAFLRWFAGSKWIGGAAAALGVYYLVSRSADAIEGSIPDFMGLALITVAAGHAGVRDWHVGVRPLSIVLLLAAPFAVALGTFNNFWAQLNFSMAFPFIALFAVAATDPIRWRQAAGLVLSVVGPVAVMLLAAFYPYSLPDSIFAQRFAIEPPLAKGPILVDEETADFITDANGLAANALLVDLSGTGPGVAAVLGARAPIIPWLNPATPAWPDLVWNRLDDEERRRSWFVAPILPAFAHTTPALWLESHRTAYCRVGLPQMNFWGIDQTLELRRPCSAAQRASEDARR